MDSSIPSSSRLLKEPQVAYNLKFDGDTAIIKNPEYFDLGKTLFCGQAFRWAQAGGVYRGVAYGRVLNLQQDNGDIMLFPVTENEFYGIWEKYFDLRRDYNTLISAYSSDGILKKGIDCAYGLRVLNQQPFETLISFILSAFNNIKRIAGIIENLCKRYGEKIIYQGRVYFAFPEARKLARACESVIRECGAGYRAEYVIEAAKKVSEGFSLEALKNLPYEKAKKELMQLKGVGGKVADCVLLYSLGFAEAFPMDVWMKRVIYNIYGFEGKDREIRDYICSRFGENAGIAQQFLFHYARTNKLGVLK